MRHDRRLGIERRDGFARQRQPGHRHRGAVARVHRGPLAGRPARGQGGSAGRQVQVDGQQRLGELFGAGEEAAGGVDRERTTVEDELVLAADKIDVHERGAGLTRSPG